MRDVVRVLGVQLRDLVMAEARTCQRLRETTVLVVKWMEVLHVNMVGIGVNSGTTVLLGIHNQLVLISKGFVILDSSLVI